MKFFITSLIALSLIALTMSSHVPNAFIANEVVPDAVDVAPQEGIKVNSNYVPKFKQQFLI